jgi:hypothetical protein
MSTRTHLDLFKRYRNEYVAPKQPRLIQIEPAQYLIIPLSDLPCTSPMDVAEKAIYALAAALRTAAAEAHQRDFILGKLEWQAHSDDPATIQPTHVLMRVPNFITHNDLECASASLLVRGLDGASAQLIRRAQLKSLREGQCAQVLHTGPNDAPLQAKTWAALHQFAEAQGFEAAGPFHVVCLASSHHVPPEHLRTLLRLPVRAAQGLQPLCPNVTTHIHVVDLA